MSHVMRKPDLCICERKRLICQNSPAHQCQRFLVSIKPAPFYILVIIDTCMTEKLFVSDLVRNSQDKFSHHMVQYTLGAI